jgi:hypothetical protein
MTDVSEERIASNIMVEKISALGTTLAVTRELLYTAVVVPMSLIPSTPLMEAMRSCHNKIHTA